MYYFTCLKCFWLCNFNHKIQSHFFVFFSCLDLSHHNGIDYVMIKNSVEGFDISCTGIFAEYKEKLSSFHNEAIIRTASYHGIRSQSLGALGFMLAGTLITPTAFLIALGMKGLKYLKNAAKAPLRKKRSCATLERQWQLVDYGKIADELMVKLGIRFKIEKQEVVSNPSLSPSDIPSVLSSR